MMYILYLISYALRRAPIFKLCFCLNCAFALIRAISKLPFRVHVHVFDFSTTILCLYIILCLHISYALLRAPVFPPLFIFIFRKYICDFASFLYTSILVILGVPAELGVLSILGVLALLSKFIRLCKFILSLFLLHILQRKSLLIRRSKIYITVI